MKAIDITEVADLETVLDEVRRNEEPWLLRRGDEDLAVVTPIPRSKRKRSRAWKPTEADMAAFRNAAGGWKDLIDVDQFLEDMYESRRISTRPPIDL